MLKLLIFLRVLRVLRVEALLKRCSPTLTASTWRALELAERGLYTTTPNPRVGCVIVRDGEVVGEGWHERAGEPHAEVIALRPLPRAPRARLPTCPRNRVHFGRTAPCTEALITARVSRVVSAMADPNPPRWRQGKRLRCGGGNRSGDRASGGAGARAQHRLRVAHDARGRPWVRVKIAASLDGRTALLNGRSQWITGPEARHDGHGWRARACAVLTGIGTVKDDDPQLTVRDVETSRQPVRIVVDSRLETPPGARVLGPGTLVAAAVRDAPRIDALAATGAEVIVMPNDAGKVDLTQLMHELARREMNEIHVEAGHKLNGSLLREGLVDEIVIYLAPHLLGDSARGMFQLPELEDLSARRELDLREVRTVGADIRIIARTRQ